MNKKISLVLLLIVQGSFCMEEGRVYDYSEELAEMRDGKSETPSATGERTPLIFVRKVSERSEFLKKFDNISTNVCVATTVLALLGLCGYVGYMLVKGSG